MALMSIVETMPDKLWAAALPVVARESDLRSRSEGRQRLARHSSELPRIAEKWDAGQPFSSDNDQVVGAHSWERRWARPGWAITLAVATPALLAAILALLALTEVVIRSALTGVTAQHAVVLCVVALATTLPPAFVGRRGAAVTVVAAGVVSIALFHTLTVAAALAAPVALYALAGQTSSRARTQETVVGIAFAYLALALARSVPGGSEAGVLTVVLAALAPAAALGGVARHAREEAARQESARRAAAGDRLEHVARGERAQIARELHDVVAHHISMVAVQAETARLATADLPAGAAQRLAAIGDTARAALTEMRRLLGVLREDARAEAPELRPQPGLEQLNELLDQARDASGSNARLILSGRPAALDPGVELAAYRIIQEALTNARRHAPGAGVDVELHYGWHWLSVRVRDTGPGPPEPAPPGGHGLTGMRERATAAGGRLVSGPAAGGGFLVEATLPADTDRSAT
jgi:signal transduction histidine kinase